MPSQLALPMRDRDQAQLVAVKVRSAAKAVVEEIGPKVFAEEWGCSEAQVSAKTGETQRHYLKPAELVQLVLQDRYGRILSVLCDAAGYEMPERKRVLEPAEKLARLEAAVTEALGPELAEVLMRKAGTL
jgi:hypothetical protein